MSYVAYVAIVAVSNLMTGFVLAIYMRGEATLPLYDGFESQEVENGGAYHSSCATTDAESELNESAHDLAGELGPNGVMSESRLDPLSVFTSADQAFSITEFGSPPVDTRAAHRSHSMDLLEGSWSDAATATLNLLEGFQSSLEAVLRRTRDSGKELSPEECHHLFSEFQDAAKNWLGDAALAANRLCAAIKKMPDGKSVSDRCERLIYDQVAQTETSVSNSLMLDWSTDSHHSVTLFVQELQRLMDSCLICGINCRRLWTL